MLLRLQSALYPKNVRHDDILETDETFKIKPKDYPICYEENDSHGHVKSQSEIDPAVKEETKKDCSV